MLAIEVASIFLVFMPAYFVLPIYIEWRRRPLCAGIVMLFVAVSPLLVERLATGYGSEGDGIAMIFLLPLPFILIVVGLVLSAVRLVRRLRTQHPM